MLKSIHVLDLTPSAFTSSFAPFSRGGVKSMDAMSASGVVAAMHHRALLSREVSNPDCKASLLESFKEVHG